jgi:hypothetical protein
MHQRTDVVRALRSSPLAPPLGDKGGSASIDQGMSIDVEEPACWESADRERGSLPTRASHAMSVPLDYREEF